MKSKLYLFGILIALVIFTGTIFKVNHWPGASTLLTAGILTLILFFVPLSLINIYRTDDNRQSVILYIITFITCLVVFTGMLFKIMHWPFAGLLVIIAFLFPYIIFLPVYLIVTSRIKNFNIYNTVFVLLLLVVNSVLLALLALNVSRERINDSYALSKGYVTTAAGLVPTISGESSPVIRKIDGILKIVDAYEEIILKQEGLSVEQWKGDPSKLQKPDLKGAAASALKRSGENSPGLRLETELKGLVSEMGKTPDNAEMSKAATVIFDLVLPDGYEPSAAVRNLTENSLSWSLIYLDSLRSDLLFLRSTICDIG